MVKLLRNIILVALLAMATNFLINRLFLNKSLPAIRGDKQLIGKLNALKDIHEGYNTVFIGSSKTHYHIAPEVFDSVINTKTGGHIKSYNFGIDGMLPMESFEVCKQLLQSKDLKIKTIIFELLFLKTNDTENIFTYRGFYWVNADAYRAYTASLTGSGLSKASKLKNLGLITFMRGEKMLNLGKVNELIDFKDNPDYTDPDQSRAGFEGLKANKLSPADAALVDATQTASKQAFSNFKIWSGQSVNQAYLEQIRQLTHLAEQQEIRLIYLMPMLWGHVWQYQELFPIFRKLPKNEQIIASDAKAYPYHFKKNQLFDAVHLSKAQAMEYTKALADTFARRKLITD